MPKCQHGGARCYAGVGCEPHGEHFELPDGADRRRVTIVSEMVGRPMLIVGVSADLAQSVQPALMGLIV